MLTKRDVITALGGSDATLLGHGTFGETWRVDGVNSGGGYKTIAAKFLRPDHFDATLAERETNWLRRLRSTGIVQLLDVVELAVSGTLHTVLLCEYIDGGSVQQKSAAGFPTEAEVITFAAALLTGVKHVHAAKAVHRDIKPANIMLSGGAWASPVLIDFGLVKGLGDATITRYPQQVGSVLWMAPEQLRGERARNASDIWACGVVIYQLLAAGAHPFFEPSRLSGVQPDELAELVDGPPLALSDSVSEPVRAIVTRMLSHQGWARGSAQRAAQNFKDLA